MAGRRTERNLPLALRPYIVSAALPLVVDMLRKDGVRVAFSSRKGRTLGYYMPPGKSGARSEQRSAALHTISLQVDLNPYALLFVFLHEWAHLLTQKQYGNEVYPHGREWKKNFKTLFRPFFRPDIFPEPILNVIAEYFNKTSRYFERDLEDACNRYGKDRKAFHTTYMRLLAQGVALPAPYMGERARKMLDNLTHAGHEERETDNREEPDSEIPSCQPEMPRETWVVSEKSAIAGRKPGERVRMEGQDYEVVEELPPFVFVRHIGNGSQVRVHELVEVERLIPLNGQE